MEKKSNSVAPLGGWVKNKLIKLITFFTCVVFIFANLFIFSFAPFGIGYKYYENTIQIGVTQESNLIETTLNTYLNELGENGYYICSTEAKTDISYKQTLINKSDINSGQLKKYIINSITVYVFSTSLKINNDETVYYFKSESECEKFVNDIKNYDNNITTDINNEIVEINQITNTQILQNIINKYHENYELKKQEAQSAAQRKNEIISRGGYTRLNSRHPLDSYTYISSEFGYRSRGFHTGVDFATPIGTEIHAWKSGTIIYAAWQGGYGNYIIIEHDDDTISCYAHLNDYACAVGDYVNCGDIIAYSGSTGNSTGPHLHFEIKINGNFVNPLNYL